MLNEYKLFYQVLTEVKTLLQTSIFYLSFITEDKKYKSLWNFTNFGNNIVTSNVLKNVEINIISVCFRNHLGHACIG